VSNDIKSYKLSPQLRAEINFQRRSSRLPKFNFPAIPSFKPKKIPWRNIRLIAGVFLIIIGSYLGIRKTYEFSVQKAQMTRQAQLEEYNKHLSELTQEVAQKTTTAQAAVVASQTYLKSGDAERAEAAARIATENDPKWRDAYTNLGQVYLAVNKFDQAKEALEGALKIDPLDGQTHYLLSLVYQELNDSNSAKTEFTKAQSFGFETDIGG